MAKGTGLGMSYFLDGVDISSDVGSLARIQGGLAVVLPVTGIDKFAYERVGGGRTGSIDAQLWHNNVAGQEHPLISTLPTADRLVTTVVAPGVLGAQAAQLVCKQADYSFTREANANLTAQTPNLSNGFGLEWTDALTFTASNSAKQVFGGAAAGSGLDYGAVIGTTAFGLQAYMHVFAFTGTSATVAIQHSNDNGGGDAYADIAGAVFAAASAIGTQRIQTARNASIKRWLRINITGTFSALTIHVGVAKNLVINTVF